MFEVSDSSGIAGALSVVASARDHFFGGELRKVALFSTGVTAIAEKGSALALRSFSRRFPKGI